MIGTLTAVLGFTFTEVSRMTFGQIAGFTKVLPDVLPYVNAFAEKPSKPITGDAAISVLRAMGVKERLGGPSDK